MEKTRQISKTIIGTSILFIISLCLLSCDGGNKRKNAFVAGTFEGVAKENENISTHLVVNEINENDYLNAAGINVVQDAWNLKYYNLKFHTIDAKGSKLTTISLISEIRTQQSRLSRFTIKATVV